MATVTPTLTLVSNDALVDKLSLSVTDSLAINGQAQFGRVKCTANTKVKLFEEDEFSGSYVYLKNLSTTSQVRTGNDSIKIFFDNEEAMLLAPGEFAFFPWEAGNTSGDIHFQAVGSSAVPIMEFAIFEFSGTAGDR